MKRFFLGMAAGYSTREVWKHTFAIGRKRDCRELKKYLRKRYGEKDTEGKVVLCKNGRSALCLALKAYFKPGEAIIVNGFTCFAVYEAIKAARLVPIWADISKEDLNFDLNRLGGSWASDNSMKNPEKASMSDKDFRGEKKPAEPTIRVAGIIVQNSLGNPIDIKQIEKIAEAHNLTIIEDLAHCAGIKYTDGREVGTVGAAAVLSFGKDKAVDTISGGAVILRQLCKNEIETPKKLPKPSDHLRARFYPFLGSICRGLTSVHLGGILMRGLVKIHWVEKSADNKLDLTRKISKFEAKLALEQLIKLAKSNKQPLREFYLVKNRGEVLQKLQKSGYYFDAFWYEKPVSPERYYKKTHFPETDCPNAVFVAEHIVNLPTYYSKQELKKAHEIIKESLIGGRDEK